MNTTAFTTRTATSQFVDVIRSPDYQSKFAAMLPGDVSIAKFTEVVLRAVQEDPNLLLPSTDKPSLFLACQRAASDGLLPDKREGALVMYGNKVQWQPMIGGLRKRLVEHGFDLRAEVVYENDTFDYDLGDNPGITHKPPAFGAERGKVIGAYAIASHTDGRKYREVMSLQELDDVASISRAGKSGPWHGPFKNEMRKKTVARRLIKSLPIDDRRLQDIIERDNEQYAVNTAPTPSDAAKRVQNAVRGIDVIDGEVIPGSDDMAGEAVSVDEPGF